MDGWNGRTGIFTCVRGIAKGTEGEREGASKWNAVSINIMHYLRYC